MSTNNSFSHLTLEERRIILTGITNGSSKTAIAQTIGKDKSTVGKEIKINQIPKKRITPINSVFMGVIFIFALKLKIAKNR